VPSSNPLTNPYAPPATPVEPPVDERDATLSSYEDERRSVLLLVMLSILTLGIYPVVWYLRRTRFLDSLDADKRVGVLPWIALGLAVLLFGVAAARAEEGAVRAVQLASGITSLVLAFRVAHILRSDLARSGRGLIRVSSAGVFFFGCLYLQHVMNQAAATPARRPRKRKRKKPLALPAEAEAAAAPVPASEPDDDPSS
jgi:hypothetical protein